MISSPPLAGIYVPLITPFDIDGSLAEAALERLARDVLTDGATGVVALGTTAETATLSQDERDAVVTICAQVCREFDASLIVGSGSNDTGGSVAALSALARWPQVRAALVPVPYFTRPSAAGVIEHFRRLSESSPVPVVAYHVPYRTACDLDAQTLAEVGRLPSVVGVKYAAGCVDEALVALCADLPPAFSVLAGDDAFLVPLLALGATGGILASAHLSTRSYVEAVDLWQAGEVASARALGRRLAMLSRAVFAAPNPTVVKGVLHAQGRIPTADVRLPLLPAERSDIVRASSLVLRSA
ncbi:4-hydroxy-tetrahydrodipicolinate synthase [Rhodococcus sp. 27YEA15]|uniref:dihydrodipicolinate synthase family protein n=1 Tax=Rhodococcus sp. 27YEA15 TaxID=3156259 RepID=UPI003C7B90B2